MSDLEQQYILVSKLLHDVARQVAQLKIQVISDYMAKQYPGVKVEVKTEEDNILSTDLVFPGMRRELSSALSREIADYLQGLLGRESEAIK